MTTKHSSQGLQAQGESGHAHDAHQTDRTAAIELDYRQSGQLVDRHVEQARIFDLRHARQGHLVFVLVLHAMQIARPCSNMLNPMLLMHRLPSGRSATRQWCQAHGIHSDVKGERPAFELASLCPKASIDGSTWIVLGAVALLAAHPASRSQKSLPRRHLDAANAPASCRHTGNSLNSSQRDCEKEQRLMILVFRTVPSSLE